MADGALAKKLKLKPGQRAGLIYSKIQTDLTRDKGWEVLQGLDLKWVTLISVNDTWSAFSLRPYMAGEAKQTMR